MKDASSTRQQSSFKSFYNKARNKAIFFDIKDCYKAKTIKIEFNNKQFIYSKEEEEYIINYVKNNILDMLKYVRKVEGTYIVKRTLSNKKNFLVIFYN